MSAVNVTNVAVLDNPSMFLNPFQFEISYECLVPLKDDLEWKLIYVGSAEDEKYDQVLESVLVGPVNVGNYRFVFQADPPELAKIPEEDIIGVTVLLLTCSYQGQEFIRVGYYVSNDYVEEALREEPPAKVVIEKVQRNILADKPRVTKFPIVFSPAAPVMDHIQEPTGAEYALPTPPSPRDLVMETNDEAGESVSPPSIPPDSMTPTDENVSEACCVASSSRLPDLMHTDEELVSEPNRPSSPATSDMMMQADDDTKPADLHSSQELFDSMQQNSDDVRRGDLHSQTQVPQEVC